MLALVTDAEALALGLRSAGQTLSGFPAVRPHQLDPIFRVIDQATEWLARERPGGGDAVRDRLLALCQALTLDPAGQFEPVRNRLLLQQARLHIHRHEWVEADRVLEPLLFRPFAAADDMGAVMQAMLLDRLVRPNLVSDQSALAALFFERLLFLFSRFRAVHERLDLLEAFAPQLLLLMKLAGVTEHVIRRTGLPAEVVASFEPAIAYLRVRRAWRGRTDTPARVMYRARHGKVFRQFHGGLCAAAAARTTFALSAASLRATGPIRPTHRTLATRGMGGIGDIATMIPGLVALADKTGAPVHFAVPRAMRALVAGFPQIVPLAIEDPIAIEDYETWFNLSECPAARVEVATVPNVDRGRIEAFANALGVTAADLDRVGWTARFQLDERQLRLRDTLRARVRDRGRTLVGVAPFSREEYKRAPALLEAARTLARHHEVVILHSRQLPALDRAGLRIAETPDLASLIAVIAACDHVVTIDTAHVHLAGALGVPTLAVFGPTDGRFMTRHYETTRLLQPWGRCPVMPCWRNEDHACRQSLGPQSLCLEHLGAAEIIEAFARLQAELPAQAETRPHRTLTAA